MGPFLGPEMGPFLGPEMGPQFEISKEGPIPGPKNGPISGPQNGPISGPPKNVFVKFYPSLGPQKCLQCSGLKMYLMCAKQYLEIQGCNFAIEGGI